MPGFNLDSLAVIIAERYAIPAAVTIRRLTSIGWLPAATPAEKSRRVSTPSSCTQLQRLPGAVT